MSPCFFTVVVLCLLNVGFIKQTSADFPGYAAKPFPISSVHLSSTSRYKAVQDNDLSYLITLDSTRLVCLYLLAANLSKTCDPYPHTGYYGHFIGHWLSGAAMMYENTQNTTLQTKMNGIIDELSKCEQAWSDIDYAGYLFPYSPVEFEILEGQLKGPIPVNVPFYVMHKVMAGLIDQYIHANSSNALALVTKMGNWVNSNVQETVNRIGINGWQNVLNTEWGGMNEAMYNLYAITGNSKYLETGDYFDHYSFTRPLANNIDDLSGLHANTHIPEIAGSARGFEVSGNETQAAIAQNFFDILNRTRNFATGGSNDGEHWGDAYSLGDQMNADTEESCTQYNILKVARYLYTWSGDSTMMDYYERAIMNGLIGNSNMNKPAYFYMNPLGGGGLMKPWGDSYEGFYCCWGTLTESFGKLSDSIYFYNDDGGSDKLVVFVNQYIASTLSYNGMTIEQKTNYPTNADGSTTHITYHNSNGNGAVVLSLRVPWWTSGDKSDGAEVSVNDVAIDNALIIPGQYLELQGLKDGDVIYVTFPMFARWERLNDNRSEWKDVGAFMYGPILLAGLTDSIYFDFNVNDMKNVIVPVGGGSNQFIAKGVNGNETMNMIPQMDIMSEQYTIYFKNGQSSIVPYDPSGSTVHITGAYDMGFTGGAGILANPLESIRSGDPNEITTGTSYVGIMNSAHKVKSVELDYQYVSGYGGNGVGIGANFTLYLYSSDSSHDLVTVYQSPHFKNYSYDHCNTCYSPPVRFTSKELNVDVSKNEYFFRFLFQNNDRNVQLLLSSLNLTVFWT